MEYLIWRWKYYNFCLCSIKLFLKGLWVSVRDGAPKSWQRTGLKINSRNSYRHQDVKFLAAHPARWLRDKHLTKRCERARREEHLRGDPPDFKEERASLRARHKNTRLLPPIRWLSRSGNCRRIINPSAAAASGPTLCARRN